MNDPPPRQCRRCQKLVTDEPMALLTMNDLDGEDTARLCPDCSRLIRMWAFTRHPPAAPPLARRIRATAASAGSTAWNNLWEDPR